MRSVSRVESDSIYSDKNCVLVIYENTNCKSLCTVCTETSLTNV